MEALLLVLLLGMLPSMLPPSILLTMLPAAMLLSLSAASSSHDFCDASVPATEGATEFAVERMDLMERTEVVEGVGEATRGSE